jgi:hypothetical protein
MLELIAAAGWALWLSGVTPAGVLAWLEVYVNG